MLAERSGFFEHANLYIAEISARFVVGLDEAREGNGAGETRWATTDEEDIHWHRFGVGWLRQNQPIQWKRSLVQTGKNFAGAIRHWQLISVDSGKPGP
jgi:hypothetical protein